MHLIRNIILFFALFCLCVQADKWVIPVENWYSTVRDTGTTSAVFGSQAETTLNWGVEYGLSLVNETSSLEVELEYFDNRFQVARGVELLINFVQSGSTISAGNPLSDVLTITGQAAAVYGIAQLSGTSTAADISNKDLYPFTLRNYVPSPFQAGGIVGTIEYYLRQEGIGWNRVALLSTAENYGINMANGFIDALAGTNIELVTYQQFVLEQEDISLEMREIQRSGARVIVTFAFEAYQEVLAEADNLDLIDEHHVYFVGSNLSGNPSTFTNDDGTTDVETASRLQGTIGCQPYFTRSGDVYDVLEAQWTSADPEVLFGGGPGTIPALFPTLVYDMGIALVLALDEAQKQGFSPSSPPTAQQWVDIVLPITFDGATDFVEYDENGDRPMPIALVNFRENDLAWRTVAVWTEEDGTEFLDGETVYWYDNTTNVPDLDIRPAFDYWSCHDKEEKRDSTGKEVSIETPDGSNVDDIDIDYHCDFFIDCQNLSDESVDCSSNYLVLFIIFGIITALFILMTCCLIPFVVIFGYGLKRKRVRASSPIFLLVIIFSCIVGFASTYAWYGKPHVVACAFQPWLLGLSVISLVAALSAKTFRIWRIFRDPYSRTLISDFKLFVLYVLMIIPAFIIIVIWTIVSTPTATMLDRGDDDHYLCTTGGFTGEPGGLVFFFVLTAYEATVLLFAAFLSIVTRNVPAFFNESKLLAISIYNLGFLAIVVIPVFLVLQNFNPFAAWIIRTVAILYGFGATLVVQFLPLIIGLVFIDRFGDAKLTPQNLKADNTRFNTTS